MGNKEIKEILKEIQAQHKHYCKVMGSLWELLKKELDALNITNVKGVGNG